MRNLVILILFTAVVTPLVATQAATIELVNGKVLKGHVIVRGDVATIRVPRQGQDPSLYQYPISEVARIKGDPKNPNLIGHRTALRAGDSRRSEPLMILERGLEITRTAARRSWIKVEGWNEDVSGYVLETDLASEVEFTPNERREVKQRLGVLEVPPPPRTTTVTRPENLPPVENLTSEATEEVSEASAENQE